MRAKVRQRPRSAGPRRANTRSTQDKQQGKVKAGAKTRRKRPQSAGSRRPTVVANHTRTTKVIFDDDEEDEDEDIADDGREDGEENKVNFFESLEKVIIGLVQENRLVEALALSSKLVHSSEVESGIQSSIYQHCFQLTLKITIELGERQEEKGTTKDIAVALDYLNDAIELTQKVIQSGLQGNEEAKVNDTLIEQYEKSKARCIDYQTILYAVTAACYRRQGNTERTNQFANLGLESSRQRLPDPNLLQNAKKTKLIRGSLEAEAKCHLMICTNFSRDGDHVGALKHARVSASILETLLSCIATDRRKSRLDRSIIKNLGISYYNVGAELEHIESIGKEFEGLLESSAASLIEEQNKHCAWRKPENWYMKALELSEKFSSVFSKDMRKTFEETALSIHNKRKGSLKHDKKKRQTTTTLVKKKAKQKVKEKNGKPPQLVVSFHDRLFKEQLEVFFTSMYESGMSWNQFSSKMDSLCSSDGSIGRYLFVQLLEPLVDVYISNDIADFLDPQSTGMIDMEVFRASCLKLARQFRSPSKGSSKNQHVGYPDKATGARRNKDEGKECIRLLKVIVRGHELDAVEIFGNLDARGEEGMLSFTQVIQGLQWLGIDLPSDKEELVHFAMQEYENALLPVRSLVNGLKLASTEEEEEEEEEEVGQQQQQQQQQQHGAPLSPSTEVVWDDFNASEIYCSEVKLDILDAFDFGKVTGAKPTQKKFGSVDPLPEQVQRVKKSKGISLPKGKVLKRVKSGTISRQSKELRDQSARNPIPISIAGWRTFENEQSVISKDGKTFKWPQMVRSNELNALLASGGRKTKKLGSDLGSPLSSDGLNGSSLLSFSSPRRFAGRKFESRVDGFVPGFGASPGSGTEGQSPLDGNDVGDQFDFPAAMSESSWSRQLRDLRQQTLHKA